MKNAEDVQTDAVAEPVIDEAAAQQAKLDAEMAERNEKAAAEHEACMADLNARREEEAKIAAVQDAALAAVRAECDAYRSALRQLEQATDAE